MIDCKWLPEKFDYPNWNDYSAYEDALYDIFYNEIVNKLFFNGKRLQIRWHPIENDKPEAFYHCTCKNYTDKHERSPDPERMVRLPWLSEIIKNSPCEENCCDEKPKMWKKKKRGKHINYIYFHRYLIIIEQRKEYYLLITAYYVEHEYYHRDLIKDYEKFILEKE